MVHLDLGPFSGKEAGEHEQAVKNQVKGKGAPGSVDSEIEHPREQKGAANDTHNIGGNFGYEYIAPPTVVGKNNLKRKPDRLNE